jgi:hypothetical protein
MRAPDSWNPKTFYKVVMELLYISKLKIFEESEVLSAVLLRLKQHYTMTM